MAYPHWAEKCGPGLVGIRCTCICLYCAYCVRLCAASSPRLGRPPGRRGLRWECLHSPMSAVVTLWTGPGCVPAAGCSQTCGPHRGSSTVVHGVACGLGEHSATLKIALTVVQHGISLLLNRDLISQEGLLRSGVVSGLEQNGQVTRIWPSPPCSCNSLPVVLPLPEISLKRTNRCKMALDALGRRSRDWGTRTVAGVASAV